MKNKVLLIVESCNPELSSVPLVGYNFFRLVENFADVHLVTHCRNRSALERHGVLDNVTYYDQSRLEIIYYKVISFFSTFRGQVIWPIRHALQFPIYFFFDRYVYREFSEKVKKGEYDVVHAMTPIMPRYPYKIIRACKSSAHKIPFILGPVNGGVPFPAAFKEIALKEFSYLNWIRKLGNWMLPGYRYTYSEADVILAGSTYTGSWIKKNFPNTENRVQLMYENGVAEQFYELRKVEREVEAHFEEDSSRKSDSSKLRLLFIGRLEPYKGCDMLVEAIGQLDEKERKELKLTIVGDGSQRLELQEYTKKYRLSDTVEFKGWIAHSKVGIEYAKADLFCFPSVREFGGAVVMEAMASGLPCVVVDNGGIGEYVTGSSGIKIEPMGREHVVSKLRESILMLARDRNLLSQMVSSAKTRATIFSWKHKREALSKIYENVIGSENTESIISYPLIK